MVFFTASSATDRSARCHSCQGSHVATWRYDAYGNTLAITGDPSLENYRFSTKPYDELTGFYYYGYRYYDPVTGRWPSRDPLWELGHELAEGTGSMEDGPSGGKGRKPEIEKLERPKKRPFRKR